MSPLPRKTKRRAQILHMNKIILEAVIAHSKFRVIFRQKPGQFSVSGHGTISLLIRTDTIVYVIK